MKKNETLILLLCDARGIYIPRDFYEGFDFGEWGLDIKNFSDLSDPDKELYWDAWDEVLDGAEHHDRWGNIWRLYQDGDLWAVRDDHDWGEEQ